MHSEYFYDYAVGRTEISLYADWPTEEDPFRVYKFTGAWVELGTKLKVVARSTYSMLDWLGDIGGLLGMLQLLGGIVLGPFARLSMKIHLIRTIFNVSGYELDFS